MVDQLGSLIRIDFLSLAKWLYEVRFQYLNVFRASIPFSLYHDTYQTESATFYIKSKH